MENNKATEILGPFGAMISASKSGYVQRNPENIAVFNANVVTLGETPKKIWFGDIDVTLSIKKLEKLASELNTEVAVLREMDARFENENSPLVGNSVIVVSPDGSVKLGKFYNENYSAETLKRI